jgi:aspartate/methionine/tyrosine aminotransferase
VQLFSQPPVSRRKSIPDEAVATARQATLLGRDRHVFDPTPDERFLQVYSRAKDPTDAMELRDLWLGRVEHELGTAGRRPWLAEQWASTMPRREVDAEEVLCSRATVRLVKELFNHYFRDDLYGELAAPDNVILSSGAVDERGWGLPEALKDCVRFALEQDWYGYSDSRGRVPAREAVAAYENARIDGEPYSSANIALTMGGTFAISGLADFILADRAGDAQPALCGIPNYPPLVEAIASRHEVRLVPLPSADGHSSLEPLIAALTPTTPLVLLQTASNPTGAGVSEEELSRLIAAADPSTMIVLDECHEWLGPVRRGGIERAARNVVRVSSISKNWSAPGMKVGWLAADPGFIAEYYEYASTNFGGPPSFFYTLIEVLARLERWMITGLDRVGAAEVAEFESSYGLDAGRLNAAYQSYREERGTREAGLLVQRDAVSVRLAQATGLVHSPRYSINTTVEFPGWDDSYRCFRDLLRETGVSVFPSILNFGLRGGACRVTTAGAWDELSSGLDRLHAHLAVGGREARRGTR